MPTTTITSLSTPLPSQQQQQQQASCASVSASIPYRHLVSRAVTQRLLSPSLDAHHQNHHHDHRGADEVKQRGPEAWEPEEEPWVVRDRRCARERLEGLVRGKGVGFDQFRADVQRAETDASTTLPATRYEAGPQTSMSMSSGGKPNNEEDDGEDDDDDGEEERSGGMGVRLGEGAWGLGMGMGMGMGMGLSAAVVEELLQRQSEQIRLLGEGRGRVVV
ncbi:hypothetical protein BDV95DRAFT_591086 [Massariosphaeria phaeospora]|uniref:Uncharacterized protein n=1 Tax=Massariosphaeria phaeospora TaxID=100035 RepID=A0A7C8MAP8_9PLEO|nr:hypothetical protein BDV95DRAFT_591086 [Massariosphaeria phaeospora]